MWHMRFQPAFQHLLRQFKASSHLVHTEKWQGSNISNKPEMATHELLNVTLETDLPTESLDYYRSDIEPNIPWADDHFLERVSGQPLNPGVQWAKWPWGHNADKFRDEHGQFNHNYMERYWPRFAGMTDKGDLDCPAFHEGVLRPRRGIRYNYGDLGSVVALLAREPLTRQAYLPVWFPEDTGVVHGDRAPCTLGYHFIMRADKLHVVYYIRSCDFVRHLRDDIYLTVRLLLWILDQLRARDERWKSVVPGRFVMHITSLHFFRNDWPRLLGDAQPPSKRG